MEIAANHEFFDEQSRHDGFARARVIGQQVAQGLFAQHRLVDGGDLVRQGLDQRGMHGDEGIEQVGEANTIGFRCEAEERSITSKTPWEARGHNFQVRYTVTVEQFTAKTTAGILVDEFYAGGAMAFDADNRGTAAGKQPFDYDTWHQFFQKCHPLPTSFPTE